MGFLHQGVFSCGRTENARRERPPPEKTHEVDELRTLTQQGRGSVPQFWCCCLATDDTVRLGVRKIDAWTSTPLSLPAHIACQEHSKTTTSRVEIWLGEDGVYVPPPRDNSGRVWTPP